MNSIGFSAGCADKVESRAASDDSSSGDTSAVTDVSSDTAETPDVGAPDDTVDVADLGAPGVDVVAAVEPYDVQPPPRCGDQRYGQGAASNQASSAAAGDATSPASGTLPKRSAAESLKRPRTSAAPRTPPQMRARAIPP